MKAVCPRHGVVELRREEYLKWWECPETVCPFVLPDDMVGSTRLIHWADLVGHWPWSGRRHRSA